MPGLRHDICLLVPYDSEFLALLGISRYHGRAPGEDSKPGRDLPATCYLLRTTSKRIPLLEKVPARAQPPVLAQWEQVNLRKPGQKYSPCRDDLGE